MKITAWKSEDGKIFEDEKDYKNHVRKLNREKKAEEKRLAKIEKINDWFDKNFWSNVKSLAQLKEAIKQNYKQLVTFSIEKSWHLSNVKKKSLLLHDHEMLAISINSSRYSDSISNTHASPEGKPTNRFQKNDLPKGYPGIKFSLDYAVNWSLRGHYDFDASSLFEGKKLHTGTGGCSSQTSNYDCYIFLDEWSALKESIEKQIIMGKLKNSNYIFNLDELDVLYPASDYKKVDF